MTFERTFKNANSVHKLREYQKKNNAIYFYYSKCHSSMHSLACLFSAGLKLCLCHSEITRDFADSFGD